MTATAVQMLWGLCLAVGAALTGLGIELHLDGAAPTLAYPLVVGGFLLLPLGSAVLERLGGTPAPPSRG